MELGIAVFGDAGAHPETGHLALEHGVAAHLVGGDDIPATERFAAEVAPAVREAVVREPRGAA